jgi:heme/copper-type cytochrome/quinol oxidase subunit 2
MQSLITLGLVWGVITVAFVALVIYRRSLTKQESDWIPLTDYG